MNTSLSMIQESERLLYTIKRLQPPAGSRLARLHQRAFSRYVRRFHSCYRPGGFALAPSQPSGVLG